MSAPAKKPWEPWKIDGANQCHEKVCTWWPWKIARIAKSTSSNSSIEDMMICSVTVMVTPAPPRPPPSHRKKTAPTRVTSPVLLAARLEKSPSTLDPAGTVAATMKISAETMRAQPER
jgi:hypothetical protein